MIAVRYSYRSGAELVRDLMKVDREQLIQREVARTAAGSPLNRALNSKQLDVLVAETHALGGEPLTRDALRSAVCGRFDTLTMKEATKPALPLVAKGGRAAEQALLKGDIASALVAKRQQATAYEMARLQKAFEPEVNAFERLANRYASNRSIANRDQEYTNQIHVLLWALGNPIARGEAELRASVGDRHLADFIQEKTAAGRIIVDSGGLPLGKPLERWTVAEFRQLSDLLVSLDHNSREENLVGQAGAKIVLDSVVAQIRENLADRRERSIRLMRGASFAAGSDTSMQSTSRWSGCSIGSIRKTRTGRSTPTSFGRSKRGSLPRMTCAARRQRLCAPSTIARFVVG
jgi:hypothetical protein